MNVGEEEKKKKSGPETTTEEATGTPLSEYPQSMLSYFSFFLS